MKPNNLPILTNTQTAMFLATKNIPYKGYSDGEAFVFPSNKEENILNDFRLVAFTWKSIVGVPYDSVYLYYINQRLIEIAQIINPTIVRRVLEDIGSVTVQGGNDTINQKIFKSLYGYLQAVHVYGLNKDTGDRIPLITLDEGLVEQDI